MQQKCLTFGTNTEFIRQKLQNPNEAIMNYLMWTITFNNHNKPFEQWMENRDNGAKISPLPDFNNVPDDHSLDLIKQHLEAFEFADNSPTSDKQRIHSFRELWKKSFIALHTIPFPVWFKESAKTGYAQEPSQQMEDIDTISYIDIKPHEQLFIFDAIQKESHTKSLPKFILDNQIRNACYLPEMQIFPEHMTPGGLFNKLHIPNYVYVPPQVMKELKISKSIEEFTHIQHLIWSRLRQAQVKAYETYHRQWAQYYNSNAELLRTPFAMRFITQDMTSKPNIQTHQVVQHMLAHKYLQQIGGPQKMDREEFYDLFIRPLEFLVGEGMPLHTMMIESVEHYASRCNLFKILLETAGFSIYDPVPIQPHYLYAEITKIRHLTSANLVPLMSHESSPYMRLEGMRF